MRAPATSFFRDIRMPRDAASHERFLLDTMVERRAEESPRTLRSFMVRAGLLR